VGLRATHVCWRDRALGNGCRKIYKLRFPFGGAIGERPLRQHAFHHKKTEPVTISDNFALTVSHASDLASGREVTRSFGGRQCSFALYDISQMAASKANGAGERHVWRKPRRDSRYPNNHANGAERSFRRTQSKIECRSFAAGLSDHLPLKPLTVFRNCWVPLEARVS